MRLRSVPAFALCGWLLAGCGGSDSSPAPGASDGTGGAVSAGGASANAGTGASAGATSAHGGTGGAAGHGGGAAGSVGVGGAGQAGKGGASGQGGQAQGGGAQGGGAQGGTSHGGSAGGPGGGGKGGSNACTVDTDCDATVPVSTPPGCAKGKCDTASHSCTYVAKDGDKDGHATSSCKASDGTPIVLGDDCDDTNAIVFPGSWDGPKGDGNPDRCDGLDENCDGTADDGHLMSGATCLCAPGDVQKCSTDAGGQPITFPELDASGNPLGKYCKIGKATCASDGKWGPCVGAVGPLPADLCDGLDENCNGKVDMQDTVQPVGQITYTFDGDLDNHAQSGTSEAKRSGCPGAPPTTCPAYFTGTCDPNMQWRTGSFPLDDCDDNNPNAFPGSQEKCNGADDDCNGKIDDNAVDASTWEFDYDGDGYGDINVKSIKSCAAPTTVPAACTTALANVPASYCAGLPPEGNPPVCPPPDCAASMWTSGIPATDCKDNPGEGGTTEGNNPSLVHPGGANLCNGLDYACQGTPDIGCGCTPLGSMKPCGDAQTCNSGTATCNGGGTWGVCSGGDPQQRFDYCMDFDGDGACDLSNCLSAACTADAPAAAGWKTKSLCAPASDCNDKDNSVIPGLPETCSGDNVDHNCNGVSNAPGAGDCDCNSIGPSKQTVIDCKPPVGYYPASATAGDPSTGMAGHVLGSALSGICKWGTAQCDSTGHLTSCVGAAPGQPTEQCVGDGLDYNCNGVLNTTMPGDCGCNNGASQACGTCLLGTQTCSNGAWGGCSGDPGYGTYCVDNDLDNYCVLSSCNVSKCPNDPLVTSGHLKTAAVCGAQGDCNDSIATAHPGAAELCGDGVNENCDAGNLDSDGFAYMSIAVGGACNNGELGACTKTGNVVCGSNGTVNPAVCNAGDWPDKASWFGKSTTVAQHGSFDTDCSGKVDIVSHGLGIVTGALVDKFAVGGCSTTPNDYCTTCQSVTGASTMGTFTFVAMCNTTNYDSSKYTAAPSMISSVAAGTFIPTCGATQLQVACHVNMNGSCASTTQTPYTQDCK